jgi:hypothetical protein
MTLRPIPTLAAAALVATAAAAQEAPPTLWSEQTVAIPGDGGAPDAFVNFLLAPDGTVRDLAVIEGATDPAMAIAALRSPQLQGLSVLRCEAPTLPYCEVINGRRACWCVIPSSDGGTPVGGGGGPQLLVLDIDLGAEAGDGTLRAGLVPLADLQLGATVPLILPDLESP